MPPKREKTKVEVPQLGELDKFGKPKKAKEAAPEEDIPPTSQETRCERIFKDLKAGFARAVKLSKDPKKQATLVMDLTKKMQECKRLIKEFEKEARGQGIATNLLNKRKMAMVDQLNSYVAQKQNLRDDAEANEEFVKAGGKPGEMPAKTESDMQRSADGMNQMELIESGRKTLKDTDQSLARSAKVVQETLAVGANTAAALHDQTKQMEKIVNDLDDIHFSMKKAGGLIRDITRQIATDKCIMFFLFLVVAGVVAIIVIKVVKPNLISGVSVPGTGALAPPSPPPPPPPPKTRRLLAAPVADELTPLRRAWGLLHEWAAASIEGRGPQGTKQLSRRLLFKTIGELVAAGNGGALHAVA